jgi:hypothetical protein
MIIKIIKDATITVKAGQSVDVSEKQAALAVKLGLAEIEKKPTKKK